MARRRNYDYDDYEEEAFGSVEDNYEEIDETEEEDDDIYADDEDRASNSSGGNWRRGREPEPSSDEGAEDDYEDDSEEELEGGAIDLITAPTNNRELDWFQVVADYCSDDDEKAKAAAEKALDCMTPLVHHIIRRRFSRYIPRMYEDLAEEGIVGILSGLSVYDPARSKPTTFFYNYILHQLHSHVVQMVNKTTSHYDATGRKVKKFIDQCNNEGRSYDVVDIAIATALPQETVRQVLSILEAKEISLETGLDTPGALETILPSNEKTPEQLVIEAEMAQALEDAITKNLSEIEIRVLEMTYGIHGCEKKTTKAISLELDLPTDRIKRYQSSAVSKLRQDKGLRSVHSDKIQHEFFFEVEDETIVPYLSEQELDDAIEILKTVELDF